MSFSLTMAEEKVVALRPGFTRSEGGVIYCQHGLSAGDACFRAEQGGVRAADDGDAERLHGSSSNSTDSSEVATPPKSERAGSPQERRKPRADTLPGPARQRGAAAAALASRTTARSIHQ
ncbi:MAG: hypothetical protein ACHQ9S_27130 [Candidatus Binatia bacterium]